jgi:RNA polymerase primary sigma factor
VSGTFDAIAGFITLELAARPGQDARQLLRRLAAHTDALDDKSALNRRLYRLARDGILTSEGDSPPRWFLRRPAEAGSGRGPRGGSTPLADRPPARTGRALRAWQAEALEAWEDNDKVGVVQAVTATGKTQVGIEAAYAEIQRLRKVLVVVPTVALLRQWQSDFCGQIPTARVGLRGDGHASSFLGNDVVVTTIHQARGMFPPGGGLIIADECHRYGASSWFANLDPRFEARLGLSATYERGDDGDERLGGYFGGEPVYEIDYRRAIDDDVVAHFKLAFVGVRLTPAEKRDYEDASRRSSHERKVLTDRFRLRREPHGEFMKDVAIAAAGRWRIGRAEATPHARRFLAAFSKRRQIVAETAAKERRLQDLVPVAQAARGTIVFTQTKAAAEEAAQLFGGVGAGAAAIYGGMEGRERENLLEAFRSGGKSVLTAPRVLDEGINVPDADLGIVLSASSSPRQMIQRMGRVLRKKDDHRRARLVVLFAHDTTEDPRTGPMRASSTSRGTWPTTAASSWRGRPRTRSERSSAGESGAARLSRRPRL